MPAVRFVRGNAFCSACFDGLPIFSQRQCEIRKVPRPAQRAARVAYELQARPIEDPPASRRLCRPTPKTDRACRRAERIHAINPTAAKFARPRPVPTPAPKIRVVTSGRSEETKSPPTPPSRGGRPRQGARLSPRELEVLRLLTESLGTKEIATALGISVRTVKLHVGTLSRNRVRVIAGR